MDAERFPYTKGDRVRVSGPDLKQHGQTGTFMHFNSDVAIYGDPEMCSIDLDEKVYLGDYALPLQCKWWELEPLEEGEVAVETRER